MAKYWRTSALVRSYEFFEQNFRKEKQKYYMKDVFSLNDSVAFFRHNDDGLNTIFEWKNLRITLDSCFLFTWKFEILILITINTFLKNMFIKIVGNSFFNTDILLFKTSVSASLWLMLRNVLYGLKIRKLNV